MIDSEIRQADLEDVPAVKALLDEVSRWLLARGINQWDQGYMPVETLTRRAERGELYVCVREGDIEGTLTLLESDPELWGNDTGFLYLHTLAVRPGIRATGLGHSMLEWVESMASARHKIGVRLDCMAHGERLRRYYRDAGYEEHRIKQMNETWIAVLFEKRL